MQLTCWICPTAPVNRLSCSARNWIDLSCLQILFSHFRPRDALMGIFINYAYICTCIRRHLKETIPSSSIAWSEIGKQKIQAKEVFYEGIPRRDRAESIHDVKALPRSQIAETGSWELGRKLSSVVSSEKWSHFILSRGFDVISNNWCLHLGLFSNSHVRKNWLPLQR